MTDDPWEEKLAETARSYNEPGDTPREEIWAGIQAARRRRKEQKPRAIWWAAGIAALIALGVGIGRLTAPDVTPEGPIAQGSDRPPELQRANVAMMVAATQHLSQAEVLLTSFRAGRGDRSVEAGFSAPARELLSTTRLLLDSPSMTDQRMRALLEELELVLAQITQLRPDQGPDEADLITNGLNQRGLLPRLRSAIPAGPAIPRA